MKKPAGFLVIMLFLLCIPVLSTAGENSGAYFTFDFYTALPATAGDTGTDEIGEVGPNQTIYMKIYIHGAKNLKAWEFKFSYNDALVDPVSAKADSAFLPDIAAEKNILKKNYDFSIYVFRGQTNNEPRVIYGGTISTVTDTAHAADGSGLAGIMAFRTKSNFSATSSAEFAFYRSLFISISDPEDGGDVKTAGLNKGYIRGGIVSDVGEETPVPHVFELMQNYPNPFNPSTRIPFRLEKSSDVTLRVFNALGQEVGMLVSGRLGAGIHEYTFDGSRLSSGIYFYVLRTEERTESRKMILMK